MFKRKHIAKEDIQAGLIVSRDKKWYQLHWRVQKAIHIWDIPIGIAIHDIEKGQEVQAKDIAVKGMAII